MKKIAFYLMIQQLNFTIFFKFFSREPLSLARMGQRLTAKSTVDISYETILSSGPASLDSVPMTSKIFTSPATPSRIPMRRGSMTVRKTNSTSSTATTASVSSPDRSLTASPIKSQSVMSVNNNGHNEQDLVNGNHHSPNKSRIPVLRSASCKIPKNICFGKSSQKAFTMKHWYQTFSNGERKDSLQSTNFAEDMKMALDN